MTRDDLIRLIRRKQSFLCVGLDPDLRSLPRHFSPTPASVLAFNQAIVDSTAAFTVCYKLNTAFYEGLGREGWDILFRTLSYIRSTHPEIMVIADAKRADIGNTSKEYARAFFGSPNELERFDAVTVAPYMGFDSVRPFLEFAGRWTILLGLTSNPGSADFQFFQASDGSYLFEEVLRKAGSWAGPDQLMVVVGATRVSYIRKARTILPNHFFLVPGVGAQGGSVEEVVEHALTPEVGLLINSSRGIIFASGEGDFAESAAKKARELQLQMAPFAGK